MAIRLYVSFRLSAGQQEALSDAQCHYLFHVMRQTEGAELVLFNGIDGEWLARIALISKRRTEVVIESQLRPQPPEQPLTLYFAPIKSARQEYMIEKAVELGITRLQPIQTQHTIAHKINRDRWQAHAIEAAEQCERLTVPPVESIIPVSNLYAAVPEERLILADESGHGVPIHQMLMDHADKGMGLIIGPEGGFSANELEKLRSLPYVTPVSLGPRVLRADTAALAAITACQILRGDWNERPRFTHEAP